MPDTARAAVQTPSAPTSRLVVFRLPEDLTSSELKDHFATLGLNVTDAKVLHRRDGQSRQMGFVGFSDVSSAIQAKEYYHGTWLKKGRIEVDFAQHVNKPVKRPLEELPSSEQSQRGHSLQSDDKYEGAAQQDTPASDDDDAHYLAKRRKVTLGPQSTNKSDDEAGTELLPVPAKPHHRQSDRIFVRNLPFTAMTDDISAEFATYGDVSEVHIPRDASGASKGIAFVRFVKATSAAAAVVGMDGSAVMGRVVQVMIAAERGGNHLQSDEAAIENGKMTSKGQDASIRGGLYLKSDTAMDVLSSRLLVPKSTLAAVDSASAAVSHTLAETLVLQENLDYLATRGISADALRAGRPDPEANTLVVRNMPAETTENTLRSLLSSCSVSPTRLVIPPSGIIAVVELATPAIAKQAMRALSYAKLGKDVLLVERAPSCIWTAAAGDVTSNQKLDMVSAVSSLSAKADDVQEKEASTSLYLKNLAFQTDAADLQELFAPMTGFVSLRLAKATNNANRNGGYGFAAFTTAKAAKMAIEMLRGTVINGRVLECQPAGTDKSGHIEAERRDKSTPGTTKLVIKNLAFEASKTDLRRLLSAYGDVQSLRLPRKADNRLRGFAFVQFATAQQAVAAMQGLRDSHLLGRHLIIEETTQS